MKTAKIGTIFLISILALAGIGVGYAAWTDTITVSGTVNTGNVDIDIEYLSSTYVWKDVSEHSMQVIHVVKDTLGAVMWKDNDWVPDYDEDILVASAETTYAGDDQITVTINNIFPLDNKCYIADVFLHYDGSIPVKINNINWNITSGNDWIEPLINNYVYGLAYTWDPQNHTFGDPVYEGYQLQLIKKFGTQMMEMEFQKTLVSSSGLF